LEGEKQEVPIKDAFEKFVEREENAELKEHIDPDGEAEDLDDENMADETDSFDQNWAKFGPDDDNFSTD